jgi:hypothetical protein
VAICNESHIPAIVEAYDTFAKGISPKLPPFVSHKLSRVDYCGNFDLSEMRYDCTVKQMLKLMKRPLVLKHYKRPMNYDMKLKRKSFYRNGFRAETKRRKMCINNYGKAQQLSEKKGSKPEDIIRAEHLIRYEVQCGAAKMRMLWNTIYKGLHPLEQNNFNVTKILLSDDFAKSILKDYFQRSIMNGDYYTLDKAVQRVDSLGCRSQRRDRLVDALILVNEHGGIESAKRHLESTSGNTFGFIESAKELANEHNINPVTTPVRVGHVPNLLATYDFMEREGFLRND